MRDARFPDLDEWCDHCFVSLRTWRCPDCERPLGEAAKQRLQSVPLEAPPNHVWVFMSKPQPDFTDGNSLVEAMVFTRIDRIARSYIRHYIDDKNGLRKTMSQIHWYQGVLNTTCYEGWDEDDEIDSPQQYVISLCEINNPEDGAFLRKRMIQSAQICICDRCKHRWLPESMPPKRCAKCKSPAWNTKRPDETAPSVQTPSVPRTRFLERKQVNPLLKPSQRKGNK